MRGRCWWTGWLLAVAAACSTPGAVIDGDRPAFDRRSVALMRTHTLEEAERLRSALLRGEPLPSATAIVPISELDQLDPALSKIAAQLGECHISSPIPPGQNRRDGDYTLLQRGSDAATPCQGGAPAPPPRSLYETINERAGELLIGLLVVGLAGFLIAVPFLFF